MSKKIGYRLHNGFVPYCESAFIVTDGNGNPVDPVEITANKITRQGNIVMAELSATLSKTIRVVVPESFRPKKIIQLYGSISAVRVYKDGTVRKLDSGNYVEEFTQMIFTNCYWTTDGKEVNNE